MTIGRRLNTSWMLLMLGLLLVGIALAGWVEENRWRTIRHNEELLSLKDRITANLDELSDSVRGLILDPKNELEIRRRREAEANLRAILTYLQNSHADQMAVSIAARKLMDFATTGALGELQSRSIKLAETDLANAAGDYTRSYAPLHQQRDQLVRELDGHLDKLRQAEEDRTWMVELLAGVFLVVLLAASLLIARAQSSAITAPLYRLTSALERMRRGDFSARLQANGNDEFGVLGEGLNRLADDLCSLVGQVQRSGSQVHATAEQITAASREQQITAREIAATTAGIGATSKEISATSKGLVKTMNEVNAVAEETANLAGSGQSAIARMEATMRQIMEASSSITAKLSALSEKTANINSVVTTITKVADQTNLLSLNAAIEAEKAGEYGLGFAVVAMEIRRLADQTAVATYDIEKMVKEMQAAVAAGVLGMDKFSEEVRHGVGEVHQVSTHLAQIINQVQTLSPRFQTVNEGMHAQATGAQQISETLEQLSEAAHQTAESLRRSNLAIEQLNEAARGLQTSTVHFKLQEGAPAPPPAAPR